MKKMIPVILVTMLAVLLIGVKLYPEFKEKKTATIPQTDTKKVVKSSHRFDRNQNKPGEFEFFPKEREEEVKKSYPDKYEIMKKVYYSLDYVNMARGKFEVGDARESLRVQFAVDYRTNQKIETKEVIRNGKVVETEKLLVRDGLLTRQLPEKQVYCIFGKTADEAQFPISYMKGSSRYVLQMQEDQFLHEAENWSYTEGVKFGMPVYEIKGEVQRASESLAGPYTMTISKDTGVLLDLKSYDANQHVKYFVRVDEMELNKEIQQKDNVFHLDLSSNKEIAWKEYFPLTDGSKGIKR